MTALSANLVASKDRTPNRVALRCDDLQFTYASSTQRQPAWRRCWQRPESSPAIGSA